MDQSFTDLLGHIPVPERQDETGVVKRAGNKTDIVKMARSYLQDLKDVLGIPEGDRLNKLRKIVDILALYRSVQFSVSQITDIQVKSQAITMENQASELVAAAINDPVQRTLLEDQLKETRDNWKKIVLKAGLDAKRATEAQHSSSRQSGNPFEKKKKNYYIYKPTDYKWTDYLKEYSTLRLIKDGKIQLWVAVIWAFSIMAGFTSLAYPGYTSYEPGTPFFAPLAIDFLSVLFIYPFVLNRKKKQGKITGYMMNESPENLKRKAEYLNSIDPENEQQLATAMIMTLR